MCSSGEQLSEKVITQVPEDWSAEIITVAGDMPETNAWLAFRKSFKASDLEAPVMKIAVDSKYWLWVNGKLVVREGGLKRGPTPDGTYYDQVDLTDVLVKGDNSLAVLVWYFGKDGFTHKSSGQAGLLAEITDGNKVVSKSDESWTARVHPAYITESDPPQPNYRLPESNIVFDASKDMEGWTSSGYNTTSWPYAKVVGVPNGAPWGKLEKRPIPFWKDFGLKDYVNNLSFPFISNGDTIVAKLPYNAQVTPYLKVNSSSSNRIVMFTDHYKGGSAYNMRAEYITKEGQQEYESPGWINGHNMYYIIPKGVEVHGLKYRESGYYTEFAGSFECNDPFYNRLWEKALRTLYITMRDNYMDCPDRERAQWWGDVVLESGESYYSLDRQSDLLTRKAILELMSWQRPDSTIYSPIPAGNWNQELPTQMLASVGYQGFWNYYWHTGDLETIREIYDAVFRYVSLWKLLDDGTVEIRKGGWTWGDWGQNKDMPLLFNTQYYLALKGLFEMSNVLGKMDKAEEIARKMSLFKESFNKVFWKQNRYISEGYQGLTDDRSQALAVVAGLVDEEKYESIYKILQTQRHASPYMEKYVLESLFIMGYPDYGLQRMKERFSKMVNHPDITTLWEGWGIGAEGYGGGTTNHAWSGGGLTILSQYVAGIYPLEAAYSRFQVKPQLGFLKNIKTVVPTVKGDIKLTIKDGEVYSMKLEVPNGTTAVVYLPARYEDFEVNDKLIFKHKKFKKTEGLDLIDVTTEHRVVEVRTGIYSFYGQ